MIKTQSFLGLTETEVSPFLQTALSRAAGYATITLAATNVPFRRDTGTSVKVASNWPSRAKQGEVLRETRGADHAVTKYDADDESKASK